MVLPAHRRQHKLLRWLVEMKIKRLQKQAKFLMTFAIIALTQWRLLFSTNHICLSSLLDFFCYIRFLFKLVTGFNLNIHFIFVNLLEIASEVQKHPEAKDFCFARRNMFVSLYDFCFNSAREFAEISNFSTPSSVKNALFQVWRETSLGNENDNEHLITFNLIKIFFTA